MTELLTRDLVLAVAHYISGYY